MLNLARFLNLFLKAKDKILKGRSVIQILWKIPEGKVKAKSVNDMSC